MTPMEWVRILCWTAIIGLSSLVAGYITVMIVDVMHDMDATPRKKMVVCDRHGMIPEDAQWTLLEDMELVGSEKRQPVRVCPYCFEERIKQAREKMA